MWQVYPGNGRFIIRKKHCTVPFGWSKRKAVAQFTFPHRDENKPRRFLYQMRFVIAIINLVVRKVTNVQSFTYPNSAGDWQENKEQIYCTTLWDHLLVLSASMQTICETISLAGHWTLPLFFIFPSVAAVNFRTATRVEYQNNPKVLYRRNLVFFYFFHCPVAWRHLLRWSSWSNECNSWNKIM